MKKESQIGIVIIIGALSLWLFYKLNESKKLRKENKSLKKDRLKLIRENLKNKKGILPYIQSETEKLVIEYQGLDPKVHKELLDVRKLIEQGMETKAITALVKIIENLLKDEFSEKILKGKYSNEEEFKKKKRKITLYEVIKFAKSINFFSEGEYSSIDWLRKYRNQLNHELGIESNRCEEENALLIGIRIVFKLKSKPKPVGDNVYLA